MMRHSFLVFIAFSVAFKVPIIEAADEYSAKVSQTFNKESGKCTAEIVMVGHGINDGFEGHCEENGIKYLVSKNVLLIGEPEKNSFSLFSNKPNTVMVVRKDECRRRSYTTSAGITTHRITPLGANDCERIKNEIKEELKNNADKLQEVAMPPKPETEEKVDPPKVEGRTGPHEGTEEGDEPHAAQPVEPPFPDGKGDEGLTDGNGVNSPTYKFHNKVYIGRQCVHEIGVKGHGIKDTFKTDCSTVGIKEIATDSLLIFGNPKYSSFVLFSNEKNTLYIINDDQCGKKIYNTDAGKTTSTGTVLTMEECLPLALSIIKQIEEHDKMVANQKKKPSVSNIKIGNKTKYPGVIVETIRKLLRYVLKNKISN